MSIGNRLREERERIGLTQQELAARGGVAKKSQTNYELGKTDPAASYLGLIVHAGVDVLFVLTGQRSAPANTGDPEEMELLRRFRDAPTDYRRMALGLLGAAPDGTTSAPAPAVSFNGTIHADTVQQVGGDQKIRKATVNIGTAASRRKKKGETN